MVDLTVRIAIASATAVNEPATGPDAGKFLQARVSQIQGPNPPAAGSSASAPGPSK